MARLFGEQHVVELIDKITGSQYSFVQVPLIFGAGTHKDIFRAKNNKTLAQTLLHSRYSKLSEPVQLSYAHYLNMPLGIFLGELKDRGDSFYQRFLNRYGDLTYSEFRIDEPRVEKALGVYAYCTNGDLRYIGRCKDSMKRRVNMGYGKIHPKNCYLDGQATNCRLNGLITAARSTVSLRLCQLGSLREIEAVERALIRAYRPPWNLQLS